jgi:hypothetical protein
MTRRDLIIKRATCARGLGTLEPQLCRKRGECAELELGVPGIVGTSIRAGALLSDLGTVYFVTFFKQEFGQIRSILAGNSGYKRNLHWNVV